MLQIIPFFEQYNRSPLDSVYKAMQSKDLADCVVTAIKSLKGTNNFIKVDCKEKSISKSLQSRLEGEMLCEKGSFQQAILSYNTALMLAPPNSEAMMVAYFSRAKLLFTTKQFSACVKDIETCLTLNCPDKMAEKLQELKQEACKFTWAEELRREMRCLSFADQFFKLKDQHPDIPYVSSDVEVTMESQKPKVVAAKDIPVGTILALETSFVNASHILNNICACHYCNKLCFNLMPCDGCCHALFCDSQCKEQAMKEGHNVECKIIDIILDDIKLPVKAVLKMRQMSSSWNEFISASNNLGVDRMKNSSISDIFNSQKYSLLNSHNEKHFIYGPMFNRCMYFANVIHHLDKKTSFLPTSADQKSAAIHAVSRILMHLSLNCTPVELQHFVSVTSEETQSLHRHPNKGYFPFIGNLTNSCVPNVYVAGMRNSAVLVSLMPIKKGTELTICYRGHWLEVEEEENDRHAMQLLIHYMTVCSNCIICRGDKILRNQMLNDIQKKAFEKFSNNIKHSEDILDLYARTCKALELLSEVPYSKEYSQVFFGFIECVMHFMTTQFPNVIIETLE